MKVRRSLAATGTRGLFCLLAEFWKRLSIVRAPHLPIERPATFADPAVDLGRDAGDEGMGRYVFRDHGACSDHRIAAYRDAA